MKLSRNKDGRITLVVRDASLSQVLALLAQTQNLNIVAANDIDALISITLRDVPLEEALTAILVGRQLHVGEAQQHHSHHVADRLRRTCRPTCRAGKSRCSTWILPRPTVVAESVTNFLSPIGKVTISQSNPTDNRLTQERIVVEDLPESLARIAAFICQIDRPPRQVLIEAHVLQVNLDDTCRCGVNLDAARSHLRLGSESRARRALRTRTRRRRFWRRSKAATWAA